MVALGTFHTGSCDAWMVGCDAAGRSVMRLILLDGVHWICVMYGLYDVMQEVLCVMHLILFVRVMHEVCVMHLILSRVMQEV